MPSFAMQEGNLKKNNFQLVPSPGLAGWLKENDCCIALTTYQSGQVLIIGRDENDNLMYTVRTYEHAMGVATAGEELYLGTLYQIWRFKNIGALPDRKEYDAVYTPLSSTITGQMFIHDLAIEQDGRLVFVNTLYCCLGTLSENYSFLPLWKPDWITELAPEDRCHLNGLATRDGKVRYVTSVSQTDVANGWRENRNGSGVLWDIQENQSVVEGLAMPHSPRWHDGRIWFLNSGTGYLCSVDEKGDNLKEVGFVPGFARGLTLHNSHALIGTSAQRENRTFSDLPLDETLRSIGIEGVCALHLVNKESGVIDHWLRIEGDIRELYDIAVLPGKRLANLIGFMNEDVRQIISIPPSELKEEGFCGRISHPKRPSK